MSVIDQRALGYLERGVKVGDDLGAEFCFRVKREDAEIESAALVASVGEGREVLRRAGATQAELDMWIYGVITGMIPHALVWNFG